MTGLRKSEDERREELLRAARAVAMAEGLDNVTGRKVAAKAGLSSGLVFFYFKGRAELLEALLDSLLEDLLGGLEVPEAPTAGERMARFFEQRLARMRRDRRLMELFFDFWVLGAREPAIRRRIREGLEAYRNAVRPTADLVAEEQGVSGAGLAQLAVSVVLGSALQVMVDSGRLDAGEYLDAVRGLLLNPEKQS